MDHLEVRPSRIHGKGVFARKRLAARRKIGEFLGELISVREARRRAKHAAVVTIVEFEDGKALDVATDPCLRYVNHSCRPNTFLRRANRRVELYTLRDIKPGEELTCDYGETHHEGTLPCQCGAEGCRSLL
ncbi:MAG: SET domain-containing protein [Thermoanaerobaculia bacterium]